MQPQYSRYRESVRILFPSHAEPAFGINKPVVFGPCGSCPGGIVAVLSRFHRGRGKPVLRSLAVDTGLSQGLRYRREIANRADEVVAKPRKAITDIPQHTITIVSGRDWIMGKRKPKASKNISRGEYQKGAGEPPASKCSETDNAPNPHWTKFTEKYPRHPALQDDTIHALPHTLTNAIHLEIPDFFSETEEMFERDLARLSGVGFFLKHPFDYPPIPGSSFDDNAEDRPAVPRHRYRRYNVHGGSS